LGPFRVQSHSGFSPFGVESHSGLGPFEVQSIRGSVHSRLSLSRFGLSRFSRSRFSRWFADPFLYFYLLYGINYAFFMFSRIQRSVVRRSIFFNNGFWVFQRSEVRRWEFWRSVIWFSDILHLFFRCSVVRRSVVEPSDSLCSDVRRSVGESTGWHKKASSRGECYQCLKNMRWPLPLDMSYILWYGLQFFL
jgi:hypothetical protein